MNRIIKATAVAALTGALAIAAATPSQARHGRNAALIGGFAAGALIGAAAANNGYYYGPGYYYDEPGYTYAPYPYDDAPDAYAYEPAPVYGGPRHYYYGHSSQPRCGGSPASLNYVPCIK
jgi:hypothetical protein